MQIADALTGAGVVEAVDTFRLGLVTLIGSWLPAPGKLLACCLLPPAG